MVKILNLVKILQMILLIVAKHVSMPGLRDALALSQLGLWFIYRILFLVLALVCFFAFGCTMLYMCV